MALIRWEPIAELNTLQNEMNRLFDTFFDQSVPTGGGGIPGRRWIPAWTSSRPKITTFPVPTSPA